MTLKRIALLGATGSIGKQTLEVVREHPERFEITVMTARSQASLLIAQALEFRPKQVVIGDPRKYDQVALQLQPLGIEVLCGEDALCEVVQNDVVDTVVTALVGAAGLKPTVAAIKAGKHIALANKETLVVAGDLIMELARQHEVQILPVDSEHSAIFQCLMGENPSSVEKIILTASGGPFFGKSRADLEKVTSEQALKHPNWSMGAKISIDSASMMNKGLEVIEAKWLFALEPEQIEVIVHRQSIIHSMVQFYDGSVIAQLGLPDMKLPIQYALGFPERLENSFARMDFLKYPELTFEAVDRSVFSNLDLAYSALEAGGNRPCVLNAANEVAVEAFLQGRLKFLQISDVISKTLETIPQETSVSLENRLENDAESRFFAKDFIKRILQ